MSLDESTRARIRDVSAVGTGHSALRLLVLFGSRARGETRAEADWDVGYVAGAGLDVEALSAALSSALRSDRVDLVDLEHANGLLRMRAASDGVALYEREADAFLSFQIEASTFWCDAEFVLRAGHEAVLARLGP